MGLDVIKTLYVLKKLNNPMKIIPLAFDSLGTRSMATYVETKDLKILIDPAVALAPERSGLPPHPIEIARMGEQWAEIKKYARKCDALIVTHYHFDHHIPDEPGVYKGKIVFLKNPKEKINRSQIERSKKFLKNLGDMPKEIIYSDGTEHKFGATKIRFSQPVPHGKDDYLGYVTEVLIDDGETKFLFTSDVLGPCTDDQTKFILGEKPDILFTDGPMGFTAKEAVANLKKIISECNIETIVIDHHLLRDLHWKKKIAEVFKAAEGKTKVVSAAGFLGREEDLLEARRKKLYEEKPV